MPPDAAGLDRSRRLVDGNRFSAIFEYRKRLHGTNFSAHVAPNDLGFARIGLAVSKRVSKKAVERNRIKRLIRESFRHHQERLGEIDYIVVAKQGAAEKQNQDLRSELDKLWAMARRKCEN